VNTESNRIWKDVGVTLFKELFRNLTGGTKEKHDRPVSIAVLQIDILVRDIHGLGNPGFETR
jgi:hypothetical protein